MPIPDSHGEQQAFPSGVKRLVEQLVAMQPSPESVWLIGSRANGRATPDSDWDLVVIGSHDLLRAIKAPEHESLNHPDVDLLVVTDGDNFESPFDQKYGSLSAWNWDIAESGQYAKYQGTHWTDDCAGAVSRGERAVRIWTRA